MTDFGIAKAVSSASGEPLTRTGVAIGTPGYMSPEQAAGGTEVNERTDVYSLACVVYEMLLGGVPSRWLSYEELEQGRFLRAPPAYRARLAELPDPVERALVRAMAIDPERRHRTPNELFHALTAAAPPARRFSDTEAKDILRRAAGLEATEPAATEDFSLTGVKRIAAEVNIPSRHVMAAADELEQPVAATTARILGVPTGWQVSRTVQGMVPEREFPVLLDIVQETMGQSGVIQAALPGVFSWASAVGDEARRAGGSAKVQVSPRTGRTKITVSEDHTMTVAASIGVGAVLAGMLAMLAGSTGVPPVALPALGLAGGGAVFWLRRSVKARRAKLGALLDRLSHHLAVSGRPELPPGPGR